MADNSLLSGTAAGSDECTSVAGMVTLSHFALIHASGDDTQNFLHGQFSCDVNSLQIGSALYGSYNTPKGRMLASFLLWRDDTGYMLQLPRSVCESVRKRLSMYVLRSKVKLLDVSDDHTILGLVGAAAITQAAQLLGTLPPNALSLNIAADVQVLRLDGARVQIIARRKRADEIQRALADKVPVISAGDWDLTNIRAGIPYIVPATQDQFVPQMANMDLINGVSFTKGCYPGQEIVARMHYLGRLKQRMYLATTSGADAPQPGDKLYSRETGEQATGMILNSAPAPDGNNVLLAVLHIESFKGDDVHLKSPSGPHLKFMELPYAIPS
jgi:folate-binding protein YgfZ